ncbi:MAG TPA: ATP-binding protein [Ohtaekwangia sp.]
MNIRTRLTVAFFSMVIVVLTSISVSIYFFSANYREHDFYRRLQNRAINTARVLTEVSEVDAALLRRMERNNPASLPNQYIVIYNDSLKELYNSEGAHLIPFSADMLNQIKAGKDMRYRDGKFEVLGFTFSDERDRFIVMAAAIDVYGHDALRNLSKILMITFCVSLFFVSILGWLFAGRALRPISRIVSEVSTISEENLSLRLNEGNKHDELGKLAQTFNSMLARLHNAFTAQKNFIANASHEIKTPITVMSGQIEVTLLQDREKEHYQQVLRTVLQSLKAMNKVSHQLLLLAHTSAGQPGKNFAALRVDDALWEMKEELLKAFPEYSIDVNFDLQVGPELLQIAGDEQLIRVALLNLMDNGCKYSDNKQVSVYIHSRQKDQITLSFTNTGPGINADQLDKIFQPFFRGHQNSKKTPGFGIGLSLVSRIIELHKGKITVESVPTKSTRFTIELPVWIQGRSL